VANRIAENNVNYQERASEYAVGDVVMPFGAYGTSGRVTSVWPAIGMIDVEFPTGNKRVPAEDLQRLDTDGNFAPPTTDSSPANGPTVSVPGGPVEQVDAPREREVIQQSASRQPDPSRVARAVVKRALYWRGKDRQYRATREEIATGHYGCPKCKEGTLRPATYKRRNGMSEKLLGCPSCLFLVKKADIIGDPDYSEPVEPKPEPFADRRVV
jgi:hypothetical protein